MISSTRIYSFIFFFFFFQAEDGIRDLYVTGVQTCALPIYQWRFWRQLPGGGQIAMLFGSWYTQPIVDRAFKNISKGEYESQLGGIAALERTLTDNGALLVKLWFHVSKKEQKHRLKDIAKAHKRQLTPYEKAYSK